MSYRSRIRSFSRRTPRLARRPSESAANAPRTNQPIGIRSGKVRGPTRETPIVRDSTYRRIPGPVAAAHPGVAETTHWRVDGAPRREEGVVDVDGAAVDIAGDFGAPIPVPRPHARVEPVRGVVGGCDRGVGVWNGCHGDHWTERLLARDGRIRLHVGQDRRLVAVRRHVGTGAAARQHGRAALPRVVDVVLDPIELGGVDERADLGVVVVTGPQREPFRLADERVDELVVGRLNDIDSLRRQTELPSVREAGLYRAAGRLVDVGVVEDDEGLLPPSSSEQSMRFRPARSATIRPVSVLPVNAT